MSEVPLYSAARDADWFPRSTQRLTVSMGVDFTIIFPLEVKLIVARFRLSALH